MWTFMQLNSPASSCHFPNSPSSPHIQLTYKSGDADILPIVDPHDGRDDLVNEALRHPQLQQRIGQRPPGHVDEATASQRVQ